MRHVLATPGLEYFHTTYLFYPFGTTIANHPHTALPAMIAATVLKSASPATAQNLLLLAYVFANQASAYALCWDITRHRRAAVLGGVIFGLSPYLAAHLLGHFDLVAAWVLPLFALSVRRATLSGATRWSIAAGMVLAVTVYTAYYYVVYLAFFLAIYLIAWLEWVPVGWSPRTPSRTTVRVQRAAAAVAILLATIVGWILLTGGGAVTLGRFVVPVHTPQNALSGIWVCAVVYAATRWRATFTHLAMAPDRRDRVVAVGTWIAGVFAIGAAPLLWQAARLVSGGEYVTPAYQWRSAPRGVDLVAPLLGSPFHPWWRISERVYASAHLDRIEAIGWIGVIPALLVWRALATRRRLTEDRRLWRIVGLIFAVWALGPILTVAGFDTGLKLPATLLRYLPFVANARMPGRAMVVVFMALAVLAAAAFAAASGRMRAPAAQWLIIGLVAFEYRDAPIPLTPIDHPAVYEVLNAAPAGAVCEVPFGVGDGLSTGVGSQERRALYYATLHGHPLVGGYIGRMPANAAARYEEMPIAGALLRLSDGRPDGGTLPVDDSVCRYLVVNRGAGSAALHKYVEHLPLVHVASDQARDLTGSAPERHADPAVRRSRRRERCRSNRLGQAVAKDVRTLRRVGHVSNPHRRAARGRGPFHRREHFVAHPCRMRPGHEIDTDAGDAERADRCNERAIDPRAARQQHRRKQNRPARRRQVDVTRSLQRAAHVEHRVDRRDAGDHPQSGGCTQKDPPPIAAPRRCRAREQQRKAAHQQHPEQRPLSQLCAAEWHRQRPERPDQQLLERVRGRSGRVAFRERPRRNAPRGVGAGNDQRRQRRSPAPPIRQPHQERRRYRGLLAEQRSRERGQGKCAAGYGCRDDGREHAGRHQHVLHTRAPGDCFQTGGECHEQQARNSCLARRHAEDGREPDNERGVDAVQHNHQRVQSKRMRPGGLVAHERHRPEKRPRTTEEFVARGEGGKCEVVGQEAQVKCRIVGGHCRRNQKQRQVARHPPRVVLHRLRRSADC